MIFNVVTYKDSTRIPYIEELLNNEEIEYKLYIGELSTFGWDAHKNTCIKVIEENYEQPYLIIAEDDLEFTEYFSKEILNHYIENSESSIICTGIFCEEGVLFKKGKVFVSKFRGTQLIIIFKQAYDLILEKKEDNKFFETILSEISIMKEVTFPFLTSQSSNFRSRISQHSLINKFIKETEKRIENEL